MRAEREIEQFESPRAFKRNAMDATSYCAFVLGDRVLLYVVLCKYSHLFVDVRKM